jgi:hypothetical protein
MRCMRVSPRTVLYIMLYCGITVACVVGEYHLPVIRRDPTYLYTHTGGELL